MFFRAYPGWSLKHVTQNYLFISISFYCKILSSQYCVQKYIVCLTSPSQIMLGATKGHFPQPSNFYFLKLYDVMPDDDILIKVTKT